MKKATKMQFKAFQTPDAGQINVMKMFRSSLHTHHNVNLQQKRGKTELNQKTKSSDEALVLNTRLGTERESFLIEGFKLYHRWFRTWFRMSLGQFVQFNSLCLVCHTTLDPERHVRSVLNCCWYCCWKQMRHLLCTTAMVSWCVLFIKVQKNHPPKKRVQWIQSVTDSTQIMHTCQEEQADKDGVGKHIAL